MCLIGLMVVVTLSVFFVDPGQGLLRVILDFDHWEVYNGSSIINMEKFRVRKYNRTLSVMNGTGVLTTDLDNRYSYGITFARSAQGNNQFYAHPIKFSSRPFCDFINSYYREFQYLFLNYTNLPFVPNEGLCPFPNGSYWIKDGYIDSSIIPATIPDGIWRCITDLSVTKTGEILFRGIMYVKLTKEIA
ncbi:uncharacterized protein LOC128721741 [Anopheles nili]|uniref:uncharacterized protein LOC128721741 n=1 Tax=Anopheles nili TaxID=185578 RepID=UPI00237C45F4|nr:uncharacterized protein LOC128721741 [Anopheles nili]